MDVALILAAFLLAVAVAFYVGRGSALIGRGRELADLRDQAAVATLLAQAKQDYIDGLWMPKECRQHVFAKEPVLRKAGQLKFLCQRCGEIRWTTKAA